MSDTKCRGPKRKLDNTSASGGKKQKGELSIPILAKNAYPKEHPFNRDGYRYILAEADPHAPLKQEFDDSTEMAGKPIPGFLCRVITPETVLLSFQDRAPQVSISEDRLTVNGYKCYCLLRATHSTNRGNWYFETKVTEMHEGGAARIGWAQANANLQAPLGFDKFGYSFRSRKGTKFHASIGKSYCKGGYKEGDTIGCLIVLPEIDGYDYLPDSYKNKPLIKFKSHLYYEEKDRFKENEAALRPLKGSKIIFFLNGECLGDAFEDIYLGNYFPAISTFKGARVRANFGPKFLFPPKTNIAYTAMSLKSQETAIEQCLANLKYFTVMEGKLNLMSYDISP